MLTPAFDLSQDSNFLTIAIRVPYARVSEFDVYFEGVDFKFYAKPSVLVLALGQRLLTSYLTGASEVSEEGVEDDDDEEFDWEVEQSPYEEVPESALNPECRYGFGNLRSGVFQRLQDELNDVIDIKDPDFTPAAERRQKRLAAELAKFDPDHYLADFFEDEAIKQVLEYDPWWTDTYSKMMASLEKSQEQENLAALVSFSEEEKYQLRKFVNKSYLLDKRAHRQVYYSLIDILLAYCYETRVTEGEKNVFGGFSVEETHRIKDEALDLMVLLALYCDLKIPMLLKPSSRFSPLEASKKLAALAEALKEASLTKAQLGLELEELEAAALLVKEEETASKAAAHSISRQQTPASSSETSDSEESDSTASSETEDSDSEQEEPRGSEPEAGNALLGPFAEKSGAALLWDAGVGGTALALPGSDVGQGKPLAPSWAPGASGPLIQELGEQLETTVHVSEPKGSAAGKQGGVRGRDGRQTPED
ncbi:protein SHQ1-like protein [Camelus ferus]|nr:protein SHQ1-like protein [Camelus ferus]